jgi:hypothetical protein
MNDGRWHAARLASGMFRPAGDRRWDSTWGVATPRAVGEPLPDGGTQSYEQTLARFRRLTFLTGVPLEILIALALWYGFGITWGGPFPIELIGLIAVTFVATDLFTYFYTLPIMARAQVRNKGPG